MVLRKYQVWKDTTEVDQVAERMELDSRGNLWFMRDDEVVGLAVAGSFRAVTSDDPYRPDQAASGCVRRGAAPDGHDRFDAGQ